MKKINPLNNAGFIFFMLFGFTACSPVPSFDQNLEIEGKAWFTKDVKEFSVPIEDKLSSYTLSLSTRHNFQYPLSNLALSIQESSPKGLNRSYRVQLQLAEPDGRWKGIGSGNLFNHQVIVLKNYHFSDTGTYLYKIKPAMNLNPLPGIVNIGLRVDKN